MGKRLCSVPQMPSLVTRNYYINLTKLKLLCMAHRCSFSPRQPEELLTSPLLLLEIRNVNHTSTSPWTTWCLPLLDCIFYLHALPNYLCSWHTGLLSICNKFDEQTNLPRKPKHYLFFIRSHSVLLRVLPEGCQKVILSYFSTGVWDIAQHLFSLKQYFPPPNLTLIKKRTYRR